MNQAPTLPPPSGGGIPLTSRWRKAIKRSLGFLAVLICVYVGAGLWAVRGDLSRGSRELPWHVIPSIMGLVFVGWGLRGLRWHYYVVRLRWSVPIGHSLWAFLASFAFSATPGKAGEVVKSVLLRTRYNVPLAEGAGVLLVERLGDLVAVLVLAAGGLALMADSLAYFLVAVLLVGGTTILVSTRAIYRPILAQVARLPKLHGLSERLLCLLDTSRTLLRPLPFLVGIGIALIAWGCEGWAFHVLLRGFGLHVEPTVSVSIYGIATVVGALSALPGGVGSFEAVMLLQLSRLKMPVAAATLPVVIFRFCTLWLGCLVGLLFLAGWLALVARQDSQPPANATPEPDSRRSLRDLSTT